ncbi:MAG TPA: class I SAM-dependent methyltransferase [Candidatus Hydrogenedentes bacterium]|nr:class I SAM-dependent methyltransferase [Candidatus Hydrogenedentota bacterium]HRK34104.1 class I SAM-dependent methyltransferase [Candidatus Hydrogenedentota bacterium]
MEPSENLYDNPDYYALAFSYRDFAREVAVFEDCIARYSKVPVVRVLEICCGHAPHIAALAERGFAYIGVDRSEAMLARAKSNAAGCGADAMFLQSGLTEFVSPAPADFAFVALASLYVTSTEELHAHFHAMAAALRPGALYLMEWCVDFDPMVDIVDSWTVERAGVTINASYWTCSINRVEQIYEDTLHLEINDNGTRHTLEDKSIRRRIFPQEFLAFVRDHTHFEFIGWWNDWDFDQPVLGDHGVDRPIVLLRKRE